MKLKVDIFSQGREGLWCNLSTKLKRDDTIILISIILIIDVRVYMNEVFFKTFDIV